jgi:hypothetical protein
LSFTPRRGSGWQCIQPLDFFRIPPPTARQLNSSVPGQDRSNFYCTPRCKKVILGTLHMYSVMPPKSTANWIRRIKSQSRTPVIQLLSQKYSGTCDSIVPNWRMAASASAVIVPFGGSLPLDALRFHNSAPKITIGTPTLVWALRRLWQLSLKSSRVADEIRLPPPKYADLAGSLKRCPRLPHASGDKCKATIPDHHRSFRRLPGAMPERARGLPPAPANGSSHHYRLGPLPGIKIHDTRIIRLMEILLHGGSTVGGWSTRQIHESMLTTFHLSAHTYGLNQLRYDLRKPQGSLPARTRWFPLHLPAHRQRRAGRPPVPFLPQATVRPPCQLPLPSPAEPQPQARQQTRGRLSQGRQCHSADR